MESSGAVLLRTDDCERPVRLAVHDGAAVERSLCAGLSRLIEGQRSFAEEFGLAYGRVFSDAMEPLKSRPSRLVLREWLAAGDAGAKRLDAMFDDLANHQLALLAALDEAVASALQSAKPKGRLAKLRQRLMAFIAPRRARALDADPTERYLHLIAPAFVAAYARVREQNNESVAQLVPHARRRGE